MESALKFFAITLISVVALAGCGNNEETASNEPSDEAQAAADRQVESNQQLEDTLSKGIADFKKSSEETSSALRQEIDSKLAEQAEVLAKKYEASNQALSDQLETLKSRYQTAKPELSEDVTQTFEQKLPELESSVGKLKGLVNQFSPESMKQVEQFTSEYQEELAVAKRISDELLKLFGNTTWSELRQKL